MNRLLTGAQPGHGHGWTWWAQRRRNGRSRFAKPEMSELIITGIFRAIFSCSEKEEKGPSWRRVPDEASPPARSIHSVTHPLRVTPIASQIRHHYITCLPTFPSIHLPSSHAPLVARLDRWEILLHVLPIHGAPGCADPGAQRSTLCTRTHGGFSLTHLGTNWHHSCSLVLMAGGSEYSTKIGFR